MPNPENLKPFSIGMDDRRNTYGRPVGAKNRSTIAKKVLEMAGLLPEETFLKIKSVFPGIEKTMTAEEIATIVMIGAAIGNTDVAAYKAVMDSAYGAPKQETDVNLTGDMVMRDHKRIVEDYSEPQSEIPGEDV